MKSFAALCTLTAAISANDSDLHDLVAEGYITASATNTGFRLNDSGVSVSGF